MKNFLNLTVIKKYYPNMIDFNDFMIWKDYIWTIPRIVSVNDLLEKVKNDRSLFDERKYDKNLLYNQALIPNMKNELQCILIR